MLTMPTGLSDEPLLTATDERELAHQIEAGVLARAARLDQTAPDGATDVELRLLEQEGEAARQRFIRANLRLVAKAARQTARRTHLSEGDLFQEGCLGLICAVERFDHRRGRKFSTYASFWIRAYLAEAAINRFGALNLSTAHAYQLREARGVEVELAQTFGRSASMAEVAAGLGRSEQWTAELLAHQSPQSFDGLDLDVYEHPVEAWSDTNVTQERPGAELLWHLEGLEREVLALRYGFADGTVHTYVEISRRLTITISRARRLEGRALERLRGVCPRSAGVYL
jgi:RNA polymerase sigma factor (sigma-70 family)